MAVDKLVDSSQLDTDLSSVANAIRTKGGTSAQLAFPAGFVSAIGDIPTGSSDSIEDQVLGYTPRGDVTYIPTKDVPIAGICGKKGMTHLTIDFASASANYQFAAPNGNGFNFCWCSIPNITIIGRGSTAIPSYLMSNCNSAQSYYKLTIRGCASLGSQNAFRGNTGLETVDFTAPANTSIGFNLFYGDSAFNCLILRNNFVSLGATSAFTNSTPFKSDGAGGTLYVPNDLIATYQGATNWSTILGYTNNKIKSIESTHTDPDAPFDMTLYYADGTAIST